MVFGKLEKYSLEHGIWNSCTGKYRKWKLHSVEHGI
jgi:hypothetical protein